jgi:hypothetical protein
VVPVSVLAMTSGPEACGAGSAILVTLGWPLGTSATYDWQARQYVRDPLGLFTARLAFPFAAVPSDLPADASFTGYRNGDAELWMSPSDVDRAIYIVRHGLAESWPRAGELIACG